MKKLIILSGTIVLFVIGIFALKYFYSPAPSDKFLPTLEQTLEKTEEITREKLNPKELEIVNLISNLTKGDMSVEAIEEKAGAIRKKMREAQEIAQKRANITKSARENLQLQNFSQTEQSKIQEIYSILMNFDTSTYQYALKLEKCLDMLIEQGDPAGFCDQIDSEFQQIKQKYIEDLMNTLELSEEERIEFTMKHNKKSGFFPFAFERENDIQQ